MNPNSCGSIEVLVISRWVTTDSWIVQVPKSMCVVLNSRSDCVILARIVNGTVRTWRIKDKSKWIIMNLKCVIMCHDESKCDHNVLKWIKICERQLFTWSTTCISTGIARESPSDPLIYFWQSVKIPTRGRNFSWVENEEDPWTRPCWGKISRWGATSGGRLKEMRRAVFPLLWIRMESW